MSGVRVVVASVVVGEGVVVCARPSVARAPAGCARHASPRAPRHALTHNTHIHVRRFRGSSSADSMLYCKRCGRVAGAGRRGSDRAGAYFNIVTYPVTAPATQLGRDDNVACQHTPHSQHTPTPNADVCCSCVGGGRGEPAGGVGGGRLQDHAATTAAAQPQRQSSSIGGGGCSTTVVPSVVQPQRGGRLRHSGCHNYGGGGSSSLASHSEGGRH